MKNDANIECEGTSGPRGQWTYRGGYLYNIMCIRRSVPVCAPVFATGPQKLLVDQHRRLVQVKNGERLIIIVSEIRNGRRKINNNNDDDDSPSYKYRT